MCDLSKTATAPSLRSYMLTQGNDMASTFPVKRSPPRDGQRYSSLTAGERCLDHCDCSIPNTVLLTVGSNQCHISDQQISCVPDQPAIACVRSASQQTHLGCIFHPRTESEKATRGLQQRRTEDGVEDGTRHRTDPPPTWNQMALDRLVSNASIPLSPGLSPALRAEPSFCPSAKTSGSLSLQSRPCVHVLLCYLGRPDIRSFETPRG
jgi:hypothetical protein